MTEISKEDLKKKLSDQFWRLNHLYWVLNEKNKPVLFKLRKIQLYLLRHLWFLNIILKARQLGVTTFFCILYLDECIFGGKDAGLIAHTDDDAKKIFEKKVKYAWDHLPAVIKDQYEMKTESKHELCFIKKDTMIESRFYVSTSLRSGTVQRLHISELATVDQKEPGKAEEIKSGALLTVHKEQVVTIESTAKGGGGVFGDICKLAMKKWKQKETLTPMDYKFFFFPWWQEEEYELDHHVHISQEEKEYFDKVEGEMRAQGWDCDITLNKRRWYVKTKEIQGDKMLREHPSTPGEAFMVSVEGAYFKREIAKAWADGRICEFPIEPTLPVYTFWDLGMKKDTMFVILAQKVGRFWHCIDNVYNGGEGFPWYVKELKEIADRDMLIYKHHYFCHDITVKEYNGFTRIETASSLGLNPYTIVPRVEAIQDKIHASRMFFPKVVIHKTRCEKLIDSLTNYQKEWDDKKNDWKPVPLHNWASHGAGSFGEMARSFTDEEESENDGKQWNKKKRR